MLRNIASNLDAYHWIHDYIVAICIRIAIRFLYSNQQCRYYTVKRQSDGIAIANIILTNDAASELRATSGQSDA